MATSADEVYDVLGVGFGPANLAIATAFADHNVAAQRLAEGGAPPSHAAKKPIKVGFVEAHPEFRWHPGMMIEGSRMQISFLKDLATIRDPTSPYTFLNYLTSQNRLVTFINRSTFAPTRREYSDYMAWVATQVVDNAKAPGDLMTGIVVHFGERVDHIEVVVDSAEAGEAQLLRVCSRTTGGEKVVRLCRNLIISSGGTPAFPRQFRTPELRNHPGIVHTSQYLDRIDELLDSLFPSPPSTIKTSESRSRSRARPQLRPTSTPPSPASAALSPTGAGTASMERRPSERSVMASLTSALHRKAVVSQGIRIAVVGGGQSSAETFLETRKRLAALVAERGEPDSARPQIDLIIRRANLYPSDDSPFSNEVFDPTSTDYYYNLGETTMPGAEGGQKQGAGKSARQHVLEEAKSTNYAVVNPTTLENVYEAMYEQRIEEDIERAAHPTLPTADAQPLAHDPKLNIIRHSEICEVSPASKGPGFDVSLRHVLTGAKTSVHYDAIVLGTGYTRQSWRDMLFDCRTTTWSKDGQTMCDIFGGGAGQPQAATVPSSTNRCDGECCVVTGASDGSTSEGTSEFTSEGTSTGTSTPESSLADSRVRPGPKGPQRGGLGTSSDVTTGPPPAPPLFGVARNYRLHLPATFKVAGSEQAVKFKPTIWLQGSNEASHGISDSLLSVLAVRSAEVLRGIEHEGWFGESR